jgi:hypothetical protein
MPATYEPITTTTFTASSGLTFNSFSGYTDLILIFAGTNSMGNSIYLRFNGDSGSNYSNTNMQGNGSAGASFRDTSATELGSYAGLNTSIPGLYKVSFFSYSNTSTNKTILLEGSVDNNGSGIVNKYVGLWRNNVAITSFTINSYGGTITGTATLYGIKAA